MNRRLMLYIGVVILMVALIILSIVFDNPYSVYLIPSDVTADIFLPDAATTEQLHDSANTQITPSPQKELLFLGQSISLQYNASLSHEMNTYTAEDRNVTCWFSVDDDKLRLISAERWFSLPEGAGAAENDYLNWIYQQVGAYYTENWDAYAKSCTTTVISTASGIPEQIERSGFSIAGEQETVIAYTFTFTRHLGEHETSDMIQAYIHPDNGFVAMGFSAHNFDDAEPVEVDMHKLERAIKNFLRKSINDNKYTYVNHMLHQPKLSVMEGKLCFVCTVSLQLTAGADAINVEQQFAVVLP